VVALRQVVALPAPVGCWTAHPEAQTADQGWTAEAVPASSRLPAAACLLLGLSAIGGLVANAGQWAAPFLILGLYNKMVKQHGSDAAINKSR